LWGVGNRNSHVSIIQYILHIYTYICPQELGSLIPWSDEDPDNGNVKRMVMKWQLEAGEMNLAEGPDIDQKMFKNSMSWTECKVG
jgi:hypothetical protein